MYEEGRYCHRQKPAPLLAAARSQYPKHKFVYRPMRRSHYVRIRSLYSQMTVPSHRIYLVPGIKLLHD